MSENRPNPDELLKKIKREEQNNDKGKLKIFFGYAAGVGKTYAMLDAAQAARKAGIDVVVGYVEPHTRPETTALLAGLEILTPLEIKHKGITLKEFDLNAALKRKPTLMIVDELPHTNVEGMRHEKRYRDIEELLDAGIDVYTTVNVQHIESLNDIVASITHVVVKERVPDRIFNEAFKVELIDIEPSELIERLNSGKIYKENQAQMALTNFFTMENLAALREIALRQTADRINKESFTNNIGGEKLYHTNERILVCLSSSPSNPNVIRTAARMAKAFHGDLVALFVETTHFKDMDHESLERLRNNLKLAESLGASIETIYGDDIAYQVAEFSKLSGISKVIVGRTKRKNFFLKRKLGFVDKLIEFDPNLDIYIIPNNESSNYPRKSINLKKIHLSAIDTLKTLGILSISIIIGFFFSNFGFKEADIITVFILGVLIISNHTNGRLYGAVSSLLSVFLFNFFFTEPRFTFNVYDASDIITFFIMLFSALITSTLTTKVKAQANLSAIVAYRSNVLLQASIELERSKSLKDIMVIAQKQLHNLLNKPVVIYTVNKKCIDKIYKFSLSEDMIIERKCTSSDDQAVVTWVIKNKKRAGVGTDTLPGSKALYIPLIEQNNVVGVIAIIMDQKDSIDSSETSLLTALLTEISFAIEKYMLAEEQKKALLQAENERFRSTLLRAVSHDLRTPLTSISGSASSILNNNFDEETKRGLISDIYDDSLWLINLIENLLSASRLDNGTVKINAEAELIEDIIDESLKHVNRNINEHTLKVDINEDLLMVNVDVRLIIQVIINIVNNAIKYTEKGSLIYIKAFSRDKKVIVEVCDNGKGISEANQKRIFDMFFTSGENIGDDRRGIGLGLALCKSIIKAHGGEIYVRNNIPTGAVIGFTLGKVDIIND